MFSEYWNSAEGTRSIESWRWIKEGFLKKKTEGLIFAAQDQALRTNWMKNMDGQEICEKCRLSGERDESIAHLILEFKELARKESQEPHDIEARIVHLGLCQKPRLMGDVNHKPNSAMKNERVKILWMRKQIGRTRIREHKRSWVGWGKMGQILAVFDFVRRYLPNKCTLKGKNCLKSANGLLLTKLKNIKVLWTVLYAAEALIPRALTDFFSGAKWTSQSTY